MKKICHVTSVHSRNDVRIFYKQCVSLAKNNYETVLLINDDLPSEELLNVKIISTGFKASNRIQRLIWSRKKLYKQAREIEAYIYQFHDPELIPLAIKLKSRMKDIKIIFDSHEDVTGQIAEKQWIPRPFRRVISFLYEQYQRRALSKFDYVFGVTPHLINKLKKVNNNVEMITNFPILKQENEINVDKKKQICFAGGITSSWNHMAVLDAIENLDISYVLCGSSSEEYIEKLQQHPAWTKVKFLGKIPFEAVGEKLKESMAGVALLEYSANSNWKNGTLGNTKLFEIMQAGIPVICTDFVIWQEIIDKYQCGICINPSDEAALTQSIKFLMDHPGEAEKMGQNGQRAVYEEYNWAMQEKKLLSVYSKL